MHVGKGELRPVNVGDLGLLSHSLLGGNCTQVNGVFWSSASRRGDSGTVYEQEKGSMCV